MNLLKRKMKQWPNLEDDFLKQLHPKKAYEKRKSYFSMVYYYWNYAYFCERYFFSQCFKFQVYNVVII